MITSTRLRRRNAQVLRSQVALELALTLLAAVAGMMLLRALLLMASVDERTWSGTILATATTPVVMPLRLLPGGTRPLIGDASLADITAAVLLLAVPLFLLSRPPRS